VPPLKIRGQRGFSKSFDRNPTLKMDRDLLKARTLAQLSYLPVDSICQYVLGEIGDDRSKLADFTAAMDAAPSESAKRSALKHLIAEEWHLQCFAQLGTPQQNASSPGLSWMSKNLPSPLAQPQGLNESMSTPEQPRATNGQFQLGVGKRNLVDEIVALLNQEQYPCRCWRYFHGFAAA
jgi:hypothetical protein